MDDAAPRSATFEYIDLAPPTTSFLDEVLTSLGKPQKELPAKFLYDERGSALFEAICALPEYYPTRTEIALMTRFAGEMATALGPDVLLIEYGSGSGAKTRILIEALRPAAYVPVDISGTALAAFARDLAAKWRKLPIVALCADYTQSFTLPKLPQIAHRRRVIYFPGSTIGNFTREETPAFLLRARALLGPGGAMLVGVDLKKDPALLHAAYNDTQGVTAAFNRNMLVRINRVLGADFDPASFWHYAFYNAPMGRIEMHLLSARKQEVIVDGRRFAFREGETIHTETSCKYDVDEFRQLARPAGFQAAHVWVDDRQLFSVHLITVE